MSTEPPHAQEAAATSVSAETVQRTAEAVAASAVAAAQAAASHGQSHSPEHVAAQAQAYWSMPPGVIPMVPGTVPGSVPGGMGVTMPAGVGGAAANPEMWLQDEREVKRQRRKQSNRESARRSRLRKQAECDDLGTRATKLVEENEQLRSENDKFKHLITQLLAEKQAVVDQVRAACQCHSSQHAHSVRTAADDSDKRVVGRNGVRYVMRRDAASVLCTET